MNTKYQECFIDNIDKQLIIKSLNIAIKDIENSDYSDESKKELITEYKRTKEKIRKYKACY